MKVIDICEKEGGNQGNQVIATVDTWARVVVVQLVLGLVQLGNDT